jgi:hypothetical protein
MSGSSVLAHSVQEFYWNVIQDIITKIPDSGDDFALYRTI